MGVWKEIVVRTRPRATLVVLLALVSGPLLLVATVQGAPAGEMVLAWHVTIAPAWFDPIDTPAQITPYGALHALHDALVRPLPGEKMGNSLAESWTESSDGLVYEFKLREGLKFHNGDPFTAEDVKFMLFTAGSGGSGNAATRIEAFVYSKGAYAMGGSADLDELFEQQAVERDPTKREALLHRIQQLVVERVMFAPVYEFRALMGVGSRVADHAINVIPMYPFPALEEMRLKSQ